MRMTKGIKALVCSTILLGIIFTVLSFPTTFYQDPNSENSPGSADYIVSFFNVPIQYTHLPVYENSTFSLQVIVFTINIIFSFIIMYLIKFVYERKKNI
jgi:hypothetical protein